ncbi:hypothetical protein BC829DRAFT_421649 [Chytridium lagenaria]|nr:hypothetical protein BC829DRAFT_421649 [Chytridium lagenaria]
MSSDKSFKSIGIVTLTNSADWPAFINGVKNWVARQTTAFKGKRMRNSAKVVQAILSNVSGDILKTINEAPPEVSKTARRLLVFLKKTYGVNNTTAVGELREKLRDIKFEAKDTPVSFISRARDPFGTLCPKQTKPSKPPKVSFANTSSKRSALPEKSTPFGHHLVVTTLPRKQPSKACKRAWKRFLQDLTCVACNTQGHISIDCPKVSGTKNVSHTQTGYKGAMQVLLTTVKELKEQISELKSTSTTRKTQVNHIQVKERDTPTIESLNEKMTANVLDTSSIPAKRPRFAFFAAVNTDVLQVANVRIHPDLDDGVSQWAFDTGLTDQALTPFLEDLQDPIPYRAGVDGAFAGEQTEMIGIVKGSRTLDMQFNSLHFTSPTFAFVLFQETPFVM